MSSLINDVSEIERLQQIVSILSEPRKPPRVALVTPRPHELFSLRFVVDFRAGESDEALLAIRDELVVQFNKYSSKVMKAAREKYARRLAKKRRESRENLARLLGARPKAPRQKTAGK